MKTTNTFGRLPAHGAAALSFVCLAALALAAQEPARPEPPPRPEPAPGKAQQGEPEKPPLELPPMPGAESNDLEKEMLELFRKVEGRLRAIDTQMYEAAAGRVPAKPVAGSGIEELLRAGGDAKRPENLAELLRSASEDSRQTQSDIQRILQIAESLDSKSGGQSGGPSKPKPGAGGNSPLDQQGKDPQGREPTPTQPGSKPEQPQQDGNQPKDGPKPDDPNRAPENRAGANPPDLQKGPGSSADGADRWGDLPVRAREIFRVEGASDLPPQYRDWIDGYYRRLQSLERR